MIPPPSFEALAKLHTRMAHLHRAELREAAAFEIMVTRAAGERKGQRENALRRVMTEFAVKLSLNLSDSSSAGKTAVVQKIVGYVQERRRAQEEQLRVEVEKEEAERRRQARQKKEREEAERRRAEAERVARKEQERARAEAERVAREEQERQAAEEARRQREEEARLEALRREQSKMEADAEQRRVLEAREARERERKRAETEREEAERVKRHRELQQRMEAAGVVEGTRAWAEAEYTKALAAPGRFEDAAWPRAERSGDNDADISSWTTALAINRGSGKPMLYDPKGGAGSEDISQGSSGTCYLLAGMAALTQRQTLLQRMFIKHDVDKGIFMIKFFGTSYKGQEECVVLLDDQLPMGQWTGGKASDFLAYNRPDGYRVRPGVWGTCCSNHW